MANWAITYIEALGRGETVQFRPTGDSMTGKIESGDLCTVSPIDHDPVEGDIVLVKVKGRVYLHLIKQISKSGTYLIGNNKGHNNGWASRSEIFGVLNSVSA
jgi:phage repressor protein C with HTH and peptisase S24 domain